MRTPAKGDGYVVGIKPKALRSFLLRIMKIQVRGTVETPEANREAASSLLDSVSTESCPIRGTVRIGIDLIALDTIAETKKHRREIG